MALDLRPLTLGELLDRSFRLYRQHFWLFVGLMALPSVLVLLMNVGILLLPEFAGSRPDELSPAFVGALVAGGLFVIAVTLAYFLTYVIAIGATTAAVSELYLGREPTIAGAYALVRGRIGRLILLMILAFVRILGIFLLGMIPLSFLGVAMAAAGAPAAAAGALAVLGTILSILAAFLYSLRYSVAVPAVMLEPISASGAIRRSIWLIRQHYWRSAVLVIFAMVITYAALVVFQAPFMIGAVMAGAESRAEFWLNLAGSVSGAIGGAVTAPVMIVGLAVLYLDLRIRKEGLDLQIMMANLDSQPPPPAAATLTPAS